MSDDIKAAVIYMCTGCEVAQTDESVCWSCDGEAVPVTNVEDKVRQRMTQMDSPYHHYGQETQ